MVKYDVYMNKFKGKYAISDYYGLAVLTCPNGIIGRSLSNPKHLSCSMSNIDSAAIIVKVYEVLGNDLVVLKDLCTKVTFTFPESQLDKVAKVLRISKRGISSLPIL